HDEGTAPSERNADTSDAVAGDDAPEVADAVDDRRRAGAAVLAAEIEGDRTGQLRVRPHQRTRDGRNERRGDSRRSVRRQQGKAQERSGGGDETAEDDPLTSTRAQPVAQDAGDDHGEAAEERKQ